MYAGTTFRVKSGRVMGVHQRIDKVARRHVTPFIQDNVNFPTYKQIVHFEGLNGPDGIKRKSPAKDEPWHFINPNDPADVAIYAMIEEHIANLAQALRDEDHTRAAFEAAWMSHAVTDGLTPAHHYPLGEKLVELRGGQPLESRSTKREKIILPGVTKRELIKNNWAYWGKGGVMTTHLGFELGVAMAISGARLDSYRLRQLDIDRVHRQGFAEEFKQALLAVNSMGMYEEFSNDGWTRNLATAARRRLVPIIIRTVALGWCEAIRRSERKDLAS